MATAKATNTTKDTFETSDLGLTCALVTAKFELQVADKRNPKRVQFIFARRGNDIDRVVDDYFADRLELKARSYFDNLKMLKNIIHSSG